MKIFFHFSVVGFSNSYIIGNQHGGDAIVVDPGVMDVELLRIVEENGYSIRYILLTHRHEAHINGIRVIKKIYDAEIYANSMAILDYPVHVLSHKDVVSLNGITVESIHVPGHSSDSLVFKIGNALFTGDVLTCGFIGNTANELSRSLLIRSIMERLMPLDETCLIFPGHGPPTTLKAEKLFNPDIIEYYQHVHH